MKKPILTELGEDMPNMDKTAYEHLWADCIQPAFERMRGKKTPFLQDEIAQSQWAESDYLAKRQQADLRNLLEHARATVPFYRRWFEDEGTSVADLVNGHLAVMPTVDRDAMAANPELYRADRPPARSFFKSTGGTTGAPLTFSVSPLSSQWRMAISRRGYEWASCFPGRRQVHLWSSDVLAIPVLKKLKKILHRALMQQKYVSSFDMLDRDGMSRVLNKINRYRPRCIVAYPSAAALLAQHMLDSGEKLESKLLSVICGGEALFNSQRDAIEKAFGCPAFETYGNREFMLIAAECEKHDGLHVSDENLIVEVLKDGEPAAPGETGEVVVTDLHNYAQPFIRYRTGDMSSKLAGPCACGRHLPRLGRIDGRSLDLIRGPDGKTLSGHFLPHFVQDFPEIERFQIKQDTPDHVIIRLVLNKPLPWESKNFMVKATEEKLPGLKCEVREVDRIEMTASGKHRTTIGLKND